MAGAEEQAELLATHFRGLILYAVGTRGDATHKKAVKGPF